MRTELQGLEGKKGQFIATFEKYGTFRSKGIVGKSILLKGLTDLKGRLLADHIWINYTPGFDAVGQFSCGDVVQFTAFVKSYVKGYLGCRIEDRLKRRPGIDYRLTFPRNVQKMVGRCE